MEENQDFLQLGGNIRLTGFSVLDGAQMVVVKKIVGNYAKRLSEICDKFESLSLTMKPVHETEASRIYEMHAKCVDNGKPIASQADDRNLFVALDSSLKKVINSIEK